MSISFLPACVQEVWIQQYFLQLNISVCPAYPTENVYYIFHICLNTKTPSTVHMHIAHCTVLPIITRLNSIIKMFRSFLASHPSPTIRAVILSILKLISPSSSCFTDTVHIIMSVKGFLYNVILQRNTTNMIFDQSVQCSLSTVKNIVYKCS